MTTQAEARATGSWQTQKGSPEPQREHGLANTMTSDFWPPELGENQSLSFYTPQSVAATGHEYTFLP